jgi:hypothetical protein
MGETETKRFSRQDAKPQRKAYFFFCLPARLSALTLVRGCFAQPLQADMRVFCENMPVGTKPKRCGAVPGTTTLV